MIRKLDKAEFQQATTLALEVYLCIMGTKNEGKHISLFFIKKEFHRKGIGKQLFDYSQCDCPANEITVNSSTYAIRFYESLGFEKTNDRQQTNGISYTPMKLISNK